MSRTAIDEVRSSLRGAESALATRRDHPSYGVTKASVRETLAIAEGMLRVLAFEAGRLTVLSVGTALLDRVGDDDPLYDLAQVRIRLSAELRAS